MQISNRSVITSKVKSLRLTIETWESSPNPKTQNTKRRIKQLKKEVGRLELKLFILETHN